MTEVVNLRSIRRAKQQRERATVAAANRALHGRTKAERMRDATDAAKRGALLDGARLETLAERPPPVASEEAD